MLPHAYVARRTCLWRWRTALCYIHSKPVRLDVADEVHNILIPIRNNEVISYDATKAPIGAFVGEQLTKFTNNEIEIRSGDMFYIFSDGYADQFGGPNNKKFLKRHLKELLAEISTEPVAKQSDLLEKAFELWKENTNKWMIFWSSVSNASKPNYQWLKSKIDSKT